MKRIFYLLLSGILIIAISGCEAGKTILGTIENNKKEIEKENKKDEAPDPTVIIEELPPTTKPKVDVPIKKSKGESQNSVSKYDPEGMPVNRDRKLAAEEKKYFPNTYTFANDITIIHYGLKEKELEYMKNQILEAKKEFFEMFGLKEDEENAADDYTDGVIITLVNNDDIYRYAGKKFYETIVHKDNDYNAGICMENNPAANGNKARILIKREPGKEFVVENLKHEFTHYLDMRYNWAGVGYEPNDWWMEGLAEYVGNPHTYSDALKSIKKKKISLRNILKTASEGNTDETSNTLKYEGGHAVVAFLFDKHIDELNIFTDYIRNGDFEKYETWMKSTEKKYSKEFISWLATQK